MPVLSNPKHELFAQWLAKGKTAEEAYAAAGYKPSLKNAQRLKCYEGVKARVAEIVGKAATKAEITVERVLAEMALLAYAPKGDTYVKASDKRAALNDLGKYLNLFKERVEHSGSIGTYDLSKIDDEQLRTLESIIGPLANAGRNSSGEGA